MTLRIEETQESRMLSAGYEPNQNSIDVEFVVWDDAYADLDPVAVKDFVFTTLTDPFGSFGDPLYNLRLQTINCRPITKSIFTAVGHYGVFEPPQKTEPGSTIPFRVKVGFSTAGGTEHITHSLETVGRYVATGMGIRADAMTLTEGDDSTDEIQLLSVVGVPTGGTFTLRFNGETTTPLAYNDNAAAVQSALESLPAIGSGNVTVNGGDLTTITPFNVTFIGSLSSTNVPQITLGTASLEGGEAPNFHRAIGVTKDGPQGCSKDIPQLAFRITANFDPTAWTPIQWLNLRDLSQSWNLSPWKGWPSTSIKFQHAECSEYEVSPVPPVTTGQLIPVTFHFLAKSEESIDKGNGIAFTKKPYTYVWDDVISVKDEASGAMVKKIRSTHEEQIDKLSDFTLLGLGS